MNFLSLSLTLLLTVLTCSGVAQVFDYQVKEDNTIVITGFQGGVADLVIPSVIDDRTVSEIGEGAFRQLQPSPLYLVSVTIPGSIKKIGDFAFSENEYLSEIVFNEGLEEIGNFSFGACRSLQDLTLPDSLTRMGWVTFGWCDLRTVEIGKGLQELGERCFHGNEDLQSFYLHPDNPYLEYVDGVLFTENLTTLIASYTNGGTTYAIPEGTVELYEGAFEAHWELDQLIFPSSLEILPLNWAPRTNLKMITVADGNPQYEAIDGVLFSIGGSHLVVFPAGKTGVYHIPEGTRTVSQRAFSDVRLTSLRIPDSVENIQNSAFWHSALGKVSLPSGLFEEFLLTGPFVLHSMFIRGDAPTVLDPSLDQSHLDYLIYYDSTTSGWGETLLGQPTLPGEEPKPYAQWIKHYPTISHQSAYDDDPDEDGLPNGLENYFGTDPTIKSEGVIHQEGVILRLVYPRAPNPAEDLDVRFQWSSDLSQYSGLVKPVFGRSGAPFIVGGEITRNTPAEGIETLQIYLGDFWIQGDPLFLRIAVDQVENNYE